MLVKFEDHKETLDLMAHKVFKAFKVFKESKDQ
jgi:hypothetical protein